MSVFEELSEITATAAEDGIEVTVNLEGRLIGLELSPRSLTRGPAKLAADIFRLTQQASAAALAEGMATLAPVPGEELTAELAELTAPKPAPVTAPNPAPDEDFSTVATWAVT